MEVISSMFEYFEALPTQNSVLYHFYQEYSPVTAITHLGPIDFNISGSDDLYLDLSTSYLILETCITKQDGLTKPGDAIDVSPVNLALHSLFQSAELKIGNTLVSDQNGYYPYRALLETLLSYSKNTQESQLKNEMFAKDKAGKMLEFKSLTGGDNEGAVTRGTAYRSGATVFLLGRPHLDLFHQAKAIPSRTPISLKLIRAADNFVLVTPAGGDPYKLIIKSAKLYIHSYCVNPELIYAHEKMLQERNIILPYKHTALKIWTISMGSTAAHAELYHGTLPDRLIMCFVSHEAMSGGFQQNPFNFQHFDLNYVSLNVNGRRVPATAYTPDMKGNYLREYNSMLEGLNQLYTDRAVNISRDEYPAGYFFLVFPLTGDNSLATLDTRNGSVSADLRFGTATAATINAVLYAEYSTYLEIDKWRNVIPHMP